MRRKVFLIGFLVLWSLGFGTSCSRESPQQPAAPAAPASRPAAQPAQPGPAAPATTEATPSSPTTATPAAGGQPAGAAATEKHRFQVVNYAQTAVTLTVNGVWVGQWDTHSGWIPLEPAVQGKNEAIVELNATPKNEVRLEIEAERGGQWVNLLRLNFQGKTGAHTYNFVAR